MAGFLPTMELNLRINQLVLKSVNRSIIARICKPLAKKFYRSVWRVVLAICSDQKRDANGLQIYKGYSICLTAQFEY